MMNPNPHRKKVLNREGKMMKRGYGIFLPACALALMLVLVGCPTSDERDQVLTMQITEDNDSLLTYDTLIVTVHSKDGTFSQEVFHDSLRNAQQVKGMPLDPRVGQDYTITIVGYKNGKIGLNKEVTFIGNGSQSKDLPIKNDVPDTVVVVPDLPVILAPSDTSIAEGDSLRFRVSVQHPWAGATTLTLKDIIPGAALDTVGRDPGDGYFTWRPNFEQGRTEPYAIAFVYSTSDRKVEKIARVKVLNVNRPPRIAAIPDQKAKEAETLIFKIEASDPDHDSVNVSATDLPNGATFSGTSFTWKPAEGQAGNYTVRFRAFDGVDSNVMSALITVGNVEVPPPLSVKITSPSQDTLVNVTPITILYTVNGTPLQLKYALKDGKNHVRIDTTVLNRPGFDTVIITLDTVPPGAPIVTGTSPIRSRVPTWNWKSGGNGIGIYRYRLDTEDMSGSTTLSAGSYTASKDLDPGTHTLYVQERDSAGNWSKSGRSAIRIDTTKPEPPGLTVTPVSPTNDTRPIWSWSGEGDDITGQYRFRIDTADFLNGGTETKGTSYQPPQGKELKEGIHTLYVQQQDSAGNWSVTSSKSIRVDLTPPNAPLDASTPFHATQVRPTWHWKSGGGGDAGIFRVKLSDSSMQSGVAVVSDPNFTPSVDLSLGLPYTLYVQERDSAGNWSALTHLSIRIHGQIGYAVGNYGTIIKTSDGGATWDTTIHSSVTQNLLSVYFTDVNTGYAVGDGGVILKTTGSGFWSQLVSGTNQTLRAILFTSEKNGIAVGANGTIIQTTDGTSWNPLTSGTAQSLATVFFTNAKTGFAAGDSGVILKTSNGGATWSPVASGMKERIGSLVFTDANTGFAFGQEGIFKTVDGGATWVSQPTGITGSTMISTYMNSASFTDANTGYAIRRDYGALTKTTNGGTPWVAVTSGLARFIETIYFIDSKTGFVAGSFGSISKSIDGGATWNLQPTGLSGTINAFDFP
jgi:photosystem II stability/assembly factor-like uncharacterized protein